MPATTTPRGGRMAGMSGTTRPAADESGARAARRKARTPSLDVRRELIAAAETVLVRDGPAAVTVRAVAAEAGIAPMGVYNRLGGKDGLIDALLIIGFDRLRDTVNDGHERDPITRMRACGQRYRQFALANRHFYAIMFEDALPRGDFSDEVAEHAATAFGALESFVTTVAAEGLIETADPREAAQQIWSSLHGAVALELKGLVLTSDPAATYTALNETLIRGLARPAAAQPAAAQPGAPESAPGPRGGPA